MKNETKKAPTIRFRGFTDDWEQRKLGDCFAERRENMPDGELLSVTINDGIKKFSELGRHDNSNDDKSKYKRVCIGDIAYNSMRMWQGASGYSIYEGIVSPAYTVLKSKSNINSRFASYLFKCQEMMYTFQVNSQGITSDNWNLKFPALSQIKVKLPCQIYEQKKVADYLSNLDGFVVLHQRKLDQLKTLKKYFLQNMFPAKGEKVSRIRFKGFTGDWEQRKFKNEVKISNEMVDPKTGLFDELIHIGPGDIEPYTGQLVSEIKTVKESDLISGKFHFYKGDIIYSKIRPELSKCIIAPEDGLASADAYVLHGNENICQEFLYCILQTRSFYSYSISVSMRTGMPKINREELGSYDFYAPSIKEQRTIGNFLIGLDKLITLHQRKLDQLQTMKKFMLQNMFI